MNSALPIVAIVKGERGHEPVFKALDLIDYKQALVGYDTMLIKVNFITDKTWDTGATTDPIVVEAIIKKLRSCPLKSMLWSQTPRSLMRIRLLKKQA